MPVFSEVADFVIRINIYGLMVVVELQKLIQMIGANIINSSKCSYATAIRGLLECKLLL